MSRIQEIQIEIQQLTQSNSAKQARMSAIMSKIAEIRQAFNGNRVEAKQARDRLQKAGQAAVGLKWRGGYEYAAAKEGQNQVRNEVKEIDAKGEHMRSEVTLLEKEHHYLRMEDAENQRRIGYLTGQLAELQRQEANRRNDHPKYEQAPRVRQPREEPVCLDGGDGLCQKLAPSVASRFGSMAADELFSKAVSKLPNAGQFAVQALTPTPIGEDPRVVPQVRCTPEMHSAQGLYRQYQEMSGERDARTKERKTKAIAERRQCRNDSFAGMTNEDLLRIITQPGANTLLFFSPDVSHARAELEYRGTANYKFSNFFRK